VRRTRPGYATSPSVGQVYRLFLELLIAAFLSAKA
jgi:hypothetical protein